MARTRSARGVDLAGRHEGQQIVERCESQRHVPPTAQSDFAQLVPALADRHAVLLQTPEQRDRIRHIPEIIGRARPDLLVVEAQHLLVLAPLEPEERKVPSDVEGEIVAAAPGRTRRLEPADALSRAPLHLMHMPHRMKAPGVGGLDLDRAPADSFGSVEMPELLERKGLTAEKKYRSPRPRETTGRVCVRSTQHARKRRRA